MRRGRTGQRTALMLVGVAIHSKCVVVAVLGVKVAVEALIKALGCLHPANAVGKLQPPVHTRDTRGQLAAAATIMLSQPPSHTYTPSSRAAGASDVRLTSMIWSPLYAMLNCLWVYTNTSSAMSCTPSCSSMERPAAADD